MIVEQDRVVSIAYQLRYDDKNGDIIETVIADEPMMFVYKREGLIPGFEKNIAGLKKGDTFAFSLPPSEAYGEEEELVELPLEAFFIDGELDNEMLQVGRVIPMTTQNGDMVQGIVAQINDNSVLMDFNHPLAGDTLFFEGTIVDVREATEEELTNGCMHQCGGCHGGGCGDNCGCDCEHGCC